MRRNVMDMSRHPRVNHVRERRRLLRWSVDIGADISGSILPRSRKVIMTEISAIGCRIVTAGRFNPGDFVMVSVPSFGPFGATVIWHADGKVGLAFARPLHAAVVAHVRRLRTKIACPIEKRWRGLAN